MLAPRLAFIDVETTGANPVVDRVTEIAILRVEDGRLVERWSSLVNPGIPIPPTIQRFTGITDAMVAQAPGFDALKDGVRALFADCVFVAHNARFDYGFIKNEFRRIGEAFDAPVLCTVKLSRALFPQYHRHGLDALIERHGLECTARHRAMGDTDALWQFAQLVCGQFEAPVLETAVLKAMKAPSRPAGLPEGALEGLPEGPGVYLFYGENDLPLYIGKSVSLRSRVMSHFSADHRNAKEARIAQQVRRVDWQTTAGELGALLLESRLVKARKPTENRQLRETEAVFGLRYDGARKRGPVLLREALNGSDPAAWEAVYGAFRSKREADNALRDLAALYKLCPRRIGTEPWGEGACMAHQMKRCAGVCAGRESPDEHDARLLKVLESLRLRRWPWDGPVAIREHHGETGRSAVHVVDRWCLLGSVEDEGALGELLAAPSPRSFDLDVYRVLSRWLDSPAARGAVTPLG
ncbi:MAG TPA: exonuclease domain-containing protein [Zoogloea sp.]|uniref:3'-5' exonuclease family protein n=1 Tax=Zoogloea sp. TaxID=49181 RepID=UPI002CCB9D86|nr:exonuclease domain-containing protein [Zoogloea sp.]HMV16574.1 exonuclease domain-containing protein [Rhodocyclaceae bacterium]HMV62017.1 exonuclease domain-containing protein [Rhodocyclaceae bacterium]HMW51190.1 exonuclease domain-containing protein [Rhodocyclaceae bacterium]HMY48724.1 exonuclease domain-containing protein [Rhodocyclaceae bacterium]HMZ76829.1 exonuclease domain-containing protein [Rhodocyclaceae bacterium]